MPIIRLAADNPMIDGRQSDTALSIRRGMQQHFETLGMVVLAEFPLASGRRADLVAVDRKGIFTLVEIKSSVEDFRSDTKWPEYKAFCDRFQFATAPDVPVEIFPAEEGLFVADDHGAECIREAGEERMAAAVRKALTLRFARLAAARLTRLERFGLESGLELVLAGEDPELPDGA